MGSLERMRDPPWYAHGFTSGGRLESERCWPKAEMRNPSGMHFLSLSLALSRSLSLLLSLSLPPFWTAAAITLLYFPSVLHKTKWYTSCQAGSGVESWVWRKWRIPCQGLLRTDENSQIAVNSQRWGEGVEIWVKKNCTRMNKYITAMGDKRQQETKKSINGKIRI